MTSKSKKKGLLRIDYNPSKLRKGFRQWLLASLMSAAKTPMLRMIDFPEDDNLLIIDMGCNIGYLTKPLSLYARTIGLDIDKVVLRSIKKLGKHLEFICCDLNYLPLRNDSVNMAVCGSAFEHIENLEQAIKETIFVLKNDGKLVAGYPIETKLLELIFQLFLKSEPAWHQRDKTKSKTYLSNPQTHKRSFTEIRGILNKHFSISKKRKIPYNFFPDFFSIYENVIMIRKKDI
jgi:ubiquinone/menaquinone biosynthesis C-methylase UbiE